MIKIVIGSSRKVRYDNLSNELWQNIFVQGRKHWLGVMCPGEGEGGCALERAAAGDLPGSLWSRASSSSQPPRSLTRPQGTEVQRRTSARNIHQSDGQTDRPNYSRNAYTSKD